MRACVPWGLQGWVPGRPCRYPGPQLPLNLRPSLGYVSEHDVGATRRHAVVCRDNKARVGSGFFFQIFLMCGLLRAQLWSPSTRRLAVSDAAGAQLRGRALPSVQEVLGSVPSRKNW